jgi:acyl-CoA thioester hydrolase
MDGFPFTHLERVRFSDLDGRNHVNNAVICTFLEQARLAWFDATGDGPNPTTYGIDVILARTEIDYRSELRFGETAEIGVRVGRIGNRSFDFEYEIRADDGRLIAEARSVQVAFDFENARSAPLPEHWRTRLAQATADAVG